MGNYVPRRDIPNYQPNIEKDVLRKLLPHDENALESLCFRRQKKTDAILAEWLLSRYSGMTLEQLLEMAMSVGRCT